jgi:uncharacterized membrane protein YeaQ/YmgE (transglycosylase-associated protein family)
MCSQETQEKNMNIIIWLVVGGLIGWVASVFMGTDGRQGLFLNVVVGFIGAALGGWLFGGAFGTSTINQGNLSLSAIMVSLVGAVLLIAVMKLFRRA